MSVPSHAGRVRLFFAFILIALALPASAWGPHPQITQAALDVLGPHDPLARQLGPNFARLTSYNWMPDWSRSFLTEPDGGIYYADDYLLFPKNPKHAAHAMPGVLTSIDRFFHRALQALRTETPVNAARWVGTLLHYTEDAGAPPHAQPGLADHGKMENWIDKTKINIAGYRPQLLGRTDDEALAAYMKRMEGLVAFSKVRAEKMAPLVKADNRAAVEPLELECANECSRVAADLLYTLGRIAPQPIVDSVTIRGKIMTKPDAPADGRLAKIVIDGTDYSTLADASGAWEFHGLPAGQYRGKVMYPGCRMDNFTVKLDPGQTRTLNILMVTLKPAQNLLRNPDLRLSWVDPSAPDTWFKSKLGWESATVPITPGRKYALNIRWKHGVKGTATVRWYTRRNPFAEGMKEEQPVSEVQQDVVFTAPEKMVSASVIIETDQPLTDVCDAVSFSALK